MDSVISLDHIGSADEYRAGGKACNCARLKQAGFLVPEGLVVSATATAAELAVLSTHPWFDTFGADALFAVRSSGIGEDGIEQSFAGIHETYLNVGRAGIAGAVAACRASARSVQALAYRRANGISTDTIQIGVLVQRMVQPSAAGVAFTLNPVTGTTSEVVINSSWGVGEKLVSGQVDPDEFHVRKDDGRVVSSVIGEKTETAGPSGASLTPSQLRELSALAVAIERHYGTPQDIEWCYDGRQFWIVQVRPVTTGRARAVETEWTRANLVEVLPDLVSPQALTAIEDLLNRAERAYMGRLMAPEDTLGPMVKSFYGRLYFNLSQLRRVCLVSGTAPALMLKSFGHADALQPADHEVGGASLWERLLCLPDILRLVSRHLRAATLFRRHERRTLAFLARISALDPGTLSDADIWSVVEQWFRDGADDLQIVLLFGGVLVHEGPVRKICDAVGFSFERLVYPQLAAGPRSVSAQQAFDILDLAVSARREPEVLRHLAVEPIQVPRLLDALKGTVFVSELNNFLARYGHRGRYESDWALPKYAEDPSPIIHAVRAHLNDAPDGPRPSLEARQRQEAGDAWRAFEQRLTRWQRWTTLPRVRSTVRTIKQYYLWREQCRSDLTRVSSALRRWHLTLAERFVERGWLQNPDDYFLLHLGEIAAAVEDRSAAQRLAGIALERTAELDSYRHLQMPLLMHEADLPRLMRAEDTGDATADVETLTGLPVSPGSVEAEVVVLRDPGEFGLMKRGAILVARATDPSWTPLFTLASGVIVEVGGVLSHASTIAREYGLPALAM